MHLDVTDDRGTELRRSFLLNPFRLAERAAPLGRTFFLFFFVLPLSLAALVCVGVRWGLFGASLMYALENDTTHAQTDMI